MPSDHRGCRWWHTWRGYLADTIVFGHHRFVSCIQFGLRSSYSCFCHGYLDHVRDSHSVYRCCDYFFFGYGPHCGACLTSDQYQSHNSYLSFQYFSLSFCLVYWWPPTSQCAHRIWGTVSMLIGCDKIMFDEVDLQLLGRALSIGQIIIWPLSGLLLLYAMVPSGYFLRTSGYMDNCKL